RFRLKGKLYEFLWLCFGLGPVPRIFTKLLKVPVSNLRRLNIRLIIYLDDILLMAQSISELLTARDSVIFLFQQLGLIINPKKSVLTPCQKMEFLGLEVDALTMTLFLPLEKVEKLKERCQKLLDNPQATLGEMASLIGYLARLPRQCYLHFFR
uniref:Reverse transcriptase domain-containing protein n=1 Tax=Clytia hemisphaerica TaxID=252671 RepID=A0A7M5U2R2_9CNID